MASTKIQKPWFKTPQPLQKSSKVAIIGGGISGITVAYHLLKAGYDATLIEKNDAILSGASGNPVAILDPYLSVGDSIESNFYAAAYCYSLNFYKSLGAEILKCSGLTKIIEKEDHIKRLNEIAKKYPGTLVDFKKTTLTFPDSGFVKPQSLAKKMSGLLKIVYNKDVSRFFLNDENRWDLYDSGGCSFLTADAIILCNSYANKAFPETEHLKLTKMSGQVSFLSPHYQGPSVLCSSSYVTPPIETGFGLANMCGATFESSQSDEVTEEAHSINIDKSPYNFAASKILGGRRSIRAMTTDHLPIAGPVANFDKYYAEYLGLRHGSNYKIFTDAPYHKNLFINVGLGARGFLTAPLLAKHIVSLLSGIESPLDEKICHAVHPARFIIRDLSKK